MTVEVKSGNYTSNMMETVCDRPNLEMDEMNEIKVMWEGEDFPMLLEDDPTPPIIEDSKTSHPEETPDDENYPDKTIDYKYILT